jgi:hypothetical protein
MSALVSFDLAGFGDCSDRPCNSRNHLKRNGGQVDNRFSDTPGIGGTMCALCADFQTVARPLTAGDDGLSSVTKGGDDNRSALRDVAFGASGKLKE